MRVLLEAFSCRDGRGSEPGQGWGWAVGLAQHGHEVTVLTQSKNRSAHDTALSRLDVNTTGRLRFVYPEPGSWSQLTGPAAKKSQYIAWSRAALRVARTMQASEPFDVAHHVTFSTALLGSSLWRLEIPFIFGPLGGGQWAPAEAERYFTASQWRRERLRTLLVRTAHLNPLAATALRRANCVAVTNRATERLAHKSGAPRIILMPDTAIASSLVAERPRAVAGRRLLWVGSDRARKGLRLALEALVEARKELDVTLTVLGPRQSVVQGIAASLHVSEHVHAPGRVSLDAVTDAYLQHDALLFTSLRESLGGQLVEACGAGLPVVGLNLHGLADLLPAQATRRVDVGGNAAEGLGSACATLLQDRDSYESASRAALAWAAQQTWPARVDEMTRIYRSSGAS